MTNSDYTHLALIVDRSGSMALIDGDMEGGIHTLLDEQAKQPGEIHVDITTFDTSIETPYVDVRPDDVKARIIVPRGGTALNDAIGSTIVRLGEKLAALAEDDRPGKVIIVVVTDGEENSSREYTTEQVKKLVEKQQADYQWEFLYLAANVDAFATGAGYGFGRGQTISYDASPDGAVAVASASSSYITRSRRGGDTEFTEEERAAAGQ